MELLWTILCAYLALLSIFLNCEFFYKWLVYLELPHKDKFYALKIHTFGVTLNG